MGGGNCGTWAQSLALGHVPISSASTITQLPEEALLEVFGRSVASPYMFLATVSWEGLVDVQLGSETFEASMKFNAEKN